MMRFGGGGMMIFLELAVRNFAGDNNTSRAACVREPHGLYEGAARFGKKKGTVRLATGTARLVWLGSQLSGQVPR